MAAPLVQYIVVRKDLAKTLNWSAGSIIAQACHASTAVLWLHRDDGNVQKYLGDVDHMHKVVLEAKNEQSLHSLAEELAAVNLKHKLWVEQPENFVTCLATVPCYKADFGQLFRKFQLMK